MSDDAACQRLYGCLDALGIAPSPAVPYPAHRTVEEGKALRGAMTGTFTKNLLLKDKRGRLFLLVAHEDRHIEDQGQDPVVAPAKPHGVAVQRG